MASSKGGTGKSMVTSTLALGCAQRGLRTLLVDLSMIAPNQEHRLGMSGAAASIPTIDELPPWSTLHQEPTTGLRVVSASRSMTARTPEALAVLVPRLLEQYDGSADVVIFDLDGLSNNALHRAVLEVADDVVFVLDHSAVTLDAVKRTALEIQNPDDNVRNGFPRVPVERCRFMFSDRTGMGGAEQTRVATGGLGRWLGHLSYSTRLDAVGEVGRLALALPASAARDADAIVARLLGLTESSSAGMSVVDLPRSARRLRRGDKVEGSGEPAPLGDRAMLEVFAGPLAPTEMSLVEFRVLAAVAGWKIASAETLAKMLDLPEKALRRIIKAMVDVGLLVVDHELVAPREAHSDVEALAAFTRQLATTGTAPANQVIEALTNVTHPAYGGAEGVWAFTSSLGHGVPLVQRANDVLVGLAEQLALNPATMAPTAAELVNALDRAGLTDLAWRARVRAPFAQALDASGTIDPPTSSAGLAPSTAPFPAPDAPFTGPRVSGLLPKVAPASSLDIDTLEWAWEEPAPETDPAVQLETSTQPVTVEVPELVVVDVDERAEVDGSVAAQLGAPLRTSQSLGRSFDPAVTLRVFGNVEVVDGKAPRAMAVVFALGVLMQPMSGSELRELTGYAESTLANVYAANAHPLVDREGGVMLLAEGVWAQHEWLAALIVESARALRAGQPGAAGEYLRAAYVYADRLADPLTGGRPFARTPQPPKEAGTSKDRAVWAWIDEPVPGGYITPRTMVGQRYAEALLTATEHLWPALGGNDLYPAGSVVATLCDAARLVPHVPVRPGETPWRSAAPRLLVAALKVANGSRALTAQVHTISDQLVAEGVLDVDNELADALGKPRE